jgi:hypothetical protein
MHIARITFILLAYASVALAENTAQRWKYEETWASRCAEEASRSRRIQGDVKAPLQIRRVEPVTKLANWNLKCTDLFPVFELVVSDKGNVICARVINFTRNKPPIGLYDYIRRNLLQFKFKPATLHGKPIQVLLNYVISYKCN